MIQRLELILFKAYCELKGEAARGYVGYAWWFIEPTLYMGAFYLVFGVLLPSTVTSQDYVSFLLIGLVFWKWFASGIAMSSSSLFQNAGVIRQVYVPKYIFPTSTVVVVTVKFLFVFFVLLVFLLLRGYHPSFDWVALPVFAGVQFLLILGISYVLAAMTPFVPDLRGIVENLLMFMFFLSGVIFDISKLDSHAELLNANPMAKLLKAYRDILLGTGGWSLSDLVIPGCLALVSFLCGKWLLNRYDRAYPKLLY